MKLMDLNERVLLMENTDLRKAIFKYIEVNTKQICTSPASINHHHNWKGGLLDHTCEVHDLAVAQALQVRNRNRPIDMDSIRASAILHDLGKIFFYEESRECAGKYYYRLKNPPDHAVVIVTDFQEVTKFPLPKNIHLNILSHEGGWSRTSVYPNTLESSIIASADLVSSRLDNLTWT